MAKHNARAELALSIRLVALTAPGFLFIALQLPAAACHAERNSASVLPHCEQVTPTSRSGTLSCAQSLSYLKA